MHSFVAQIAILTLCLFATGCFAVSAFFTVFWLRRASWDKLVGSVVGHGGRSGGVDDFCEKAIIEVATDSGSQRFSSHVASFPPIKLGTEITVLRKLDTDEFVELTAAGVFLPTVIPLLAGSLMLWLAAKTDWDIPEAENKAQIKSWDANGNNVPR